MTKFGRSCKEKMIVELEKKFERYPNFFVASFTKLPTIELDKLRTNLKQINLDCMVVKNSISKQALKKMKKDSASTLFESSCGVIFSKEDAVIAAKSVVTFAKDHEMFIIRGGFVDGAVIDESLVKQLALLPTKEVLLSKLLGTMKSPISGLVNVLSGTMRSLVYVLDGIKNKKSN